MRVEIFQNFPPAFAMFRPSSLLDNPTTPLTIAPQRASGKVEGNGTIIDLTPFTVSDSRERHERYATVSFCVRTVFRTF